MPKTPVQAGSDGKRRIALFQEHSRGIPVLNLLGFLRDLSDSAVQMIADMPLEAVPFLPDPFF